MTIMIDMRKIILVTDGDLVAQRAIKKAAANIGARFISASGGSPTPLDGNKIVEMIQSTHYDPVVVMVDDRGNCKTGKGEQALYQIANHPDIEVLGIIAVASNTFNVNGVKVDCSITKNGKIIQGSVNKEGLEQYGNTVYGDTVDIIEKCSIPVVIGIGDIGKMGGKDHYAIGSPIVTKAMEEILLRSGYSN
jgi:stage V sporulation protein AE